MSRIRPSMHARDSSGRQVSLLNDEPTPRRDLPSHERHAGYKEEAECSRANSYVSASSSPRTPGLWRSDSYDSRTSDAHSPITPTMADYGEANSYDPSYAEPSGDEKRADRASVYGGYAQDALVRYEDEGSGNPAERSAPTSTTAGKRYPCRFKETHGCDKSFTTSGHASRHSKIHTAEKAVPCVFPGCQKKFTRNDNMKQHHETHFKDRSRTGSQRHSISSVSTLTVAAGIKKPASGRQSRPSSRAGWTGPLTVNTRATFAQFPPDIHSGVFNGSAQSPTTSPRSSYGALDMAGFQHALPTPESDGLNALVAAVDSRLG